MTVQQPQSFWPRLTAIDFPDTSGIGSVTQYGAITGSLRKPRLREFAHYRDNIKHRGVYKPEAYDRMPIWVAVEAIPFGSLSRLIEASGDSGVLEEIAGSMNTSRKFLPGQVKSFVYLRNRVAHRAQLWNHRVRDVPGLQPNTTRRVKKNYRNFKDHSIYKILVALDDIGIRSGIPADWLSGVIEPILNEDPLFARGIAVPARFGELTPKILFG